MFIMIKMLQVLFIKNIVFSTSYLFSRVQLVIK
jgi:hypothetical protein